MDLEIERFKRNVDLTAFAVAKGYRLDKRESSVSSRVLRHDDGDKIIVGRARDGHWQYFSIRDGTDNGSIIDFIQKRERKNLGQVRLELRQWLGIIRDQASYLPAARVQPVTRDRAAITLEVARAAEPSGHPYLEARGLRRETLCDARFRGTWKQARGPHGNVLFLHHDLEGLSGFEVKNAGFTGFSKGGSKGLWQSAAQRGDTRLVVTESAIDALSYHQLHPHDRTRYVSVGGQMSHRQIDLLSRAMSLLPGRQGTIVAATDNDRAGNLLAGRVAELASEHGLEFVRHAPTLLKDWNEVLQAWPSRAPELCLRLVKAPGLER